MLSLLIDDIFEDGSGIAKQTGRRIPLQRHGMDDCEMKRVMIKLLLLLKLLLSKRFS